MDSKALTKIQAVILAAIIVGAVVAGVVYIFWAGEAQRTRTIKIGICAGLATSFGKDAWQGAVLAAEQINAEGGILGRTVELIGEDSTGAEARESVDAVSLAATKLITYHKVDYMIGFLGPGGTQAAEDIAANHKIIFLSGASIDDVHTERVQDNYDKYKYFFRVGGANETTTFQTLFDSVLTLREYTGFNKLGYLISATLVEQMKAGFNHLSEVEGFDLVYKGAYIGTEIDYSSFFAAAEAAGTEILVSFFVVNGLPIIEEWYDRQSPLVIWGYNLLSQGSGFWGFTGGKCEHESVMGNAASVGYPLTSKTIPFREAYIDRWGEPPGGTASIMYNGIRFILSDAIERAGTTETDAVIAALEETDIETTDSPRFMFTSSHDIMFGPGYTQAIFFQWQADGTRVPVYPRELMEEAGATYTYPPWPGPWD